MRRKTPIHLILLGTAAVAFLGGCTQRQERRARETYRDVVHGDDDVDRLELNSATKKQLSRLPGLNDEDAARIVANRPYANKRALLDRGIVGERKYDQIESYVYVDHGRR